jgi:hypothetical protein
VTLIEALDRAAFSESLQVFSFALGGSGEASADYYAVALADGRPIETKREARSRAPFLALASATPGR